MGALKPENSIPEAVLRGALGLAVITVARVGVVLTYRVGTGLVVAKRTDGDWTGPSAVATCGVGWGAQVNSTLKWKT